MKHRQRPANTRMFREPILPDNLTDLLRERLMSLRPSVKTDYLKDQVFSKFVSRDTDPASMRAGKAQFKWLCAENNNAATEDRLILTHEDYNILPHVPYSQFMEKCRGVIADIVGEVPPIDALVGAFSGGASTSRPRTQSQPALKYFGRAHVTERAYQTVYHALSECPGWFQSDLAALEFLADLEVVPGNVMFTVPKKTDIDRVAAKEPDLNMFVQKGIGNFLRKALLKRANVNLNDQSINRRLALRGSIDGSLATLDLSSASDSVTTELVFQLLPTYWFTLLDSVRSHVTLLLNGEEHRNYMFSSMGNGFTFELESLIFYALMRTTAFFTGTRGVVSVYGDDIIIPTGMASQAMMVLNYVGFEVNPDKSFVDGPFRESCGGHYWNGVDITPFYIKEPLDRIVNVIDAANKLRQWGDLKIGTESLCSVIDHEVEEIWLWLKSYVPRCLWGGADYTFKYQLVSYDTPDKRLQEVSDTVMAGDGGLSHWLNATWHRQELKEAVETSRFSTSRNQMRLRPVRDRTVPRLDTFTLEELERT